MATAITVQKATAGNLAVTPTANPADATGNYVQCALGDRITLRFANGSGSSVNVTFDDPTSAAPEGYTGFNPDFVQPVPATNGVRTVILTPERVARFRDPATGRINWTYSAAASVTVEAYGF
jgi:hypothetical protein